MVARGTLRPAATVLLLRDGQTKPEVFMVRASSGDRVHGRRIRISRRQR